MTLVAIGALSVFPPSITIAQWANLGRAESATSGWDHEADTIARQRSATAARLAAIKSDILHALGRSDLSAEMIALRHNISPRYVRKLFEQSGSSFSDFVLAERLARAQRMLADKRCTHLNIAQIAHESGFGDVSYFHRVFRRHALRLPGSGKTIVAGAGVSNEMSA